MNQSKNDLRVIYRRIRQEEKSKNYDSIITEMLLNSTLYQNAETVLVYNSIGSEIDTLPVIRDALQRKKTTALPVCLDSEGNMEFYEIENEEALKKGFFSISEPDINRCSKVNLHGSTICIVPGISFDRKGYRLGYGKGYYDRFLSNFKGVCIGLCYEKCFCEQLPFDKFDCKADVIITENDIYTINKEEYIYG